MFPAASCKKYVRVTNKVSPGHAEFPGIIVNADLITSPQESVTIAKSKSTGGRSALQDKVWSNIFEQSTINAQFAISKSFSTT